MSYSSAHPMAPTSPLKRGRAGSKTFNQKIAEATLPATMTANEAETGTGTAARAITPKVLANEIERRSGNVTATMTAQQAETGTSTVAMNITPKLLADEIDRRAVPATASAAELETGTEEGIRKVSPKLLADEIDRRAVPATASAAELETGTEEDIRKVSPKLLADEIDRRGDAAYQPLTGNTFNVAGVPAAADNVGRVIYVTDGSGGSPCAAISDGTNWKVLALGATISAV